MRFLADRYGEDKLWKLIDVQARSIFFPLWVNLRFWQAYDKTPVDADRRVRRRGRREPARPRPRPPTSAWCAPAGDNARYARAADGTRGAARRATTTARPGSRCTGPTARLRSQRELADVLPPRKLAIAAPSLASGLSFSPDGRWLYFVALDLDPTYQVARLYRYDVDAGTLAVVAPRPARRRADR